jgi:hypothetical protein
MSTWINEEGERIFTWEHERKRSDIEMEEKWREICHEVPYFTPPPGCEIAILPPFGGAVGRFRIRNPAKPNDDISVYLDWYGRLGCMGKPYWELYPNAEHDCSRYWLNETKELMNEIATLLGLKEEKSNEHSSL